VKEFVPTGRHKLTIELEQYTRSNDDVTLTCDVNFDLGMVHDWWAEGQRGGDLTYMFGNGDVYDIAWRYIERKWKREQELIALITG